MLTSILTYHSVDDSGSVISVSPLRFRRHMEALRRAAIPVVPLGRITSWLSGAGELAEGAVAITFDDGFRNFYEEAFPVLQEFGFPATVFVVTDHCGGKNDWPGQPKSIPVMDLMDWNQVRELGDHGVAFGAHTKRHPYLSQITGTRIREEIRESQEGIRDHTGKDARFFAYPYGVRTDAAAQIVQEFFDGACSVEMDFLDRNSERHFLPRIDMYYFSSNDRFSGVGARGFERYVRFRGFLRSLRKRTY